MSEYVTIIRSIVIDASWMFLGVGAVVSLIVGAWMILHASSLFEFNRYLGKWYSTRKLTRPLTAPIKSEPFIYRYHRIFGALIGTGSVYVLYQLAFYLEASAIRRLLLGPGYETHSFAWVISGTLIVLAVGCATALIVGIYLFIRPSLLKGLESWGNQWMTMRRSTKFLDIMRAGPEPFIMGHPRVVGVLIVLASLYIIVMMLQYRI